MHTKRDLGGTSSPKANIRGTDLRPALIDAIVHVVATWGAATALCSAAYFAKCRKARIPEWTAVDMWTDAALKRAVSFAVLSSQHFGTELGRPKERQTSGWSLRRWA